MNMFTRGIKLPTFKEISLSSPRFKKAPPPHEVVIHLKQHAGLHALPIVKALEKVFCGTLIAVAQGDFSANLHSSLSGTVTEVNSEWIKIESNGKDEWEASVGESKEWRGSSKDEIFHAIFSAGIVGLGGDGVPTALKIKTAQDGPTDTLILNGCESDAYLTADYVLMLNQPADVLYGAELLLKVSGLRQCIIAIQDDKIDVIELFLSKIRGLHFKNITVKKLPSKYPQGAERELARAIFGKSFLRFERAPLILNVATAFAVYEAVRFKKPLVERVVTVTGQCVVEPQNLLVRIGTPAQDLIKICKGFLRDPNRVIFGGPMSGISISSLETPLTKLTRGLVALADEYIEDGEEKACIRCGFCVEVCPESLLPETLIRVIRKGKARAARELDLARCIECGNCTYICPSKIPMSQILKEGKTMMQEALD